MQWWVIWASNQPVKGVGVTASTFQGTKAQADAKAARIVDGTVTGPYSSQQDALAAIKQAGGNGNGSAVTNPPPGPQQPNLPANPLSGIAAVGDFFQRLTQASTWIRFAEVLLGLGLIIVGLAKLAGGTSAGRAAAKAGKAAALL